MKRSTTYRPPNPAFGQWLLQKIEASGMNQKQFADRVGVSGTTVWRWVHGRVPDAVFIDPISDVLVLDYDLVSERAGYRPRLPGDDMDKVHERLDPRLQRVRWTDSRYRIIESVLDQFIQDDELMQSSAGSDTLPPSVSPGDDAHPPSDTE